MQKFTPTVAMQDRLARSYARCSAEAGPNPSVVVLSMQAEYTGVAWGQGSFAPTIQWLALGTERTARGHFKHFPPSPLEMEYAIEEVEKLVMPLHKCLPADSHLYSDDDGMSELFMACGTRQDAPQTLLLDRLEWGFSQLASVVMGSPATHSGLPQSTQFAARLLVLREFMHHLRFEQIELVDDP